MPHRVCRQPPLRSSLKLSSPALQLRLILCLVLNAAAACPVFGRRTACAHYLQPLPQLAFKLPPRMLELASLQPWCHGNKQRLHMLIICRPLSVLAFRLARATGRHESHRAVELRAIAHIIARGIRMLALRMWTGSTSDASRSHDQLVQKREREE